jgi:hypothetical protein
MKMPGTRACVAAHQHRVRRGEPLQPRREVRRLTERERLAARACPDLPDHDRPGVDADAHREPPVGRESRIHRLERLHDREPRARGTLGVVVVRGWIAEVDEESVAEVLRDVSAVLLDDACRRLLIRADQVLPRDRGGWRAPSSPPGRRTGP